MKTQRCRYELQIVLLNVRSTRSAHAYCIPHEYVKPIAELEAAGYTLYKSCYLS